MSVLILVSARLSISGMPRQISGLLQRFVRPDKTCAPRRSLHTVWRFSLEATQETAQLQSSISFTLQQTLGLSHT